MCIVCGNIVICEDCSMCVVWFDMLFVGLFCGCVRKKFCLKWMFRLCIMFSLFLVFSFLVMMLVVLFLSVCCSVCVMFSLVGCLVMLCRKYLLSLMKLGVSLISRFRLVLFVLKLLSVYCRLKLCVIDSVLVKLVRLLMGVCLVSLMMMCEGCRLWLVMVCSRWVWFFSNWCIFSVLKFRNSLFGSCIVEKLVMVRCVVVVFRVIVFVVFDVVLNSVVGDFMVEFIGLCSSVL